MSKKQVLIIAPVGLLVVLLAAYMLVVRPGSAPPGEAELKRAPGPVYALSEPFVVNLADRGGVRHFAKVGVALRFSEYSADRAPVGEGRIEEEPEIRDIVIATLQSRTSAALAEPRGREGVKRAIVAGVNDDTDLHVLDVYYTEFAVQ